MNGEESNQKNFCGIVLNLTVRVNFDVVRVCFADAAYTPTALL